MDKILTIYFFKNWQVLWQSLVYQTKSVENITWNICNSLESAIMTKSGGNQYLENFHLTGLGIWLGLVYQTKCVENINWNICNSLKSAIMTKSCVNQNLENFHLAELGISNKTVENINWKICNSLKSEKMTSLVETNT